MLALRNRWGSTLLLHPFYHIDSQIICNGTYELATHRLFERVVRPGQVCLDVGANIGEMTLHLGRLVGAGGHVHAFEPMPSNYNRLCRHIAMNHLASRVTAHPLALADFNGVSPLAQASIENHGNNTLLARSAGREPTLVQVRELDAIAAELRLSRLDLIKVDIQGSEPAFLRGAAALLRSMRPLILMEFDPDSLDVDPRELLSQLGSLGYRVFEVTRTGQKGSCIDPASIDRGFRCAAALCTPA